MMMMMITMQRLKIGMRFLKGSETWLRLRFKDVDIVKVGVVESAVVAVTAEGAVEAVLLRLMMGSVLRASPASLRSHYNTAMLAVG